MCAMLSMDGMMGGCLCGDLCVYVFLLLYCRREKKFLRNSVFKLLVRSFCLL